MTQPLCTGTMLQCTFGAAPSAFVADPLPGAPMILGSLPAGTIASIKPTNIPPFGMCQSMQNPAVASATAAAMGALTPMPCTPLVVAPWAPPAATARSSAVPIATVSSSCMCSFGGKISVATPIPGPAQTT